MGIIERKERAKEHLRKQILETAAELFLKNGFEHTSMRNIADKIEYSPTTIYLYFKDKNELLYAISESGFRLFFEYLSKAGSIKDPMERLTTMGRYYLEFAMKHSGYYDLIFIMMAPMKSDQNAEGWNLGSLSHNYLTETVEACIESGYFKGKNPEAMAHTIWSFMHGLVSLHIRDRMKMHDETMQKQLITNALNIFSEMLRKL
jgi:AcrR family transcriptional regulator